MSELVTNALAPNASDDCDPSAPDDCEVELSPPVPCEVPGAFWPEELAEDPCGERDLESGDRGEGDGALEVEEPPPRRVWTVWPRVERAPESAPGSEPGEPGAEPDEVPEPGVGVVGLVTLGAVPGSEGVVVLWAVAEPEEAVAPTSKALVAPVLPETTAGTTSMEDPAAGTLNEEVEAGAVEADDPGEEEEEEEDELPHTDSSRSPVCVVACTGPSAGAGSMAARAIFESPGQSEA
ncbi:MAG TPA: hypothetical protein VMR97_10935 [Acidimicrobiales bacterium]|nr:hypothetical protein [Acidimicrobiales bacterium]